MLKHLVGERLSDFKSVTSIPERKVQQIQSRFAQNRRESVRIAVVDDKSFEPGRLLTNHGYKISYIGDVKNVSELKDYQIVLCDLMGVGQFLDRSDEGAAIIREIRRNYPSILVAAYTGSSSGHEPLRKAKQTADVFIKKDSDIEDWTDELDALVEKALDPSVIWYRVRDELCRQRVGTVEVLRLEDAFVRSLESDDSNFNRLQEAARSQFLGVDGRAIIQGLIANTVFKVLGG